MIGVKERSESVDLWEQAGIIPLFLLLLAQHGAGAVITYSRALM